VPWPGSRDRPPAPAVFGKKLIGLGYRNVYFRQNEQSLERKVQASLTPGWHASPQNKDDLMRTYLSSLDRGNFINYCYDALKECRGYQYMTDGHVGTAKAKAAVDKSGARMNHSDRVAADALCCKLIIDASSANARQGIGNPVVDIMDNPPLGSFGWRRKQALDKDKEIEEWPVDSEPWVG